MSPRRTKLSHLQPLTRVKVKPSSWKRRRWKRNVSFVTLVLSQLQLCCPTCGKYMTTPVCTVILSATTVRTSSLSFIILNYGSGVYVKWVSTLFNASSTHPPRLPHALSYRWILVTPSNTVSILQEDWRSTWALFTLESVIFATLSTESSTWSWSTLLQFTLR